MFSKYQKVGIIKVNPCDTACAETFFALLKKGLIYRRSFINKKETTQIVNWYISSFYSENRAHSKNGYLSPINSSVENQG